MKAVGPTGETVSLLNKLITFFNQPGRCKQRPSRMGRVLRQGVASNPLQNGVGKTLASDHRPLTKSLLISAREAHPHSAIAKKNSSRKIWMTFATP